MITKEQLLDSMAHETKIVKHLAAKVREEFLDYRPTPGQRSLAELMHYMTRMAIVPTLYAVDLDWERAEKVEEEMPDLDLATFPAEMDRQMEMIAAELEAIDEAEAPTRRAKMPWGSPTTLSASLMDMSLKCLVAYRMQLFLYLKSCGVSDIGPANCWAGVDLPKGD